MHAPVRLVQRLSRILTRDVVPIPPPVLHGVAGRESSTGLVEESSDKQAATAGSALLPPGRSLFLELPLDRVPRVTIDDLRMLAVVGLAFMRDAPHVERVAQQVVEMPPREGSPPSHPAVRAATDFRREPPSIGLFLHRAHGSAPEVQLEERSHRLRLGLRDDERPPLRFKAERDVPTHPEALALRGRDLVPDALSGHLALELSEGQQHVEREPPHRGGRVELLRDGLERRIVRVQGVDDLGEVRERPSEAVDLVHDDRVDPPRLDVCEEPEEGRAFERSAGVATVVVAGANELPPFTRLTLDVGLAGFALCLERVEVLLQALFGRLPRVDGTPRALAAVSNRHWSAPPGRRSAGPTTAPR